MDTIKILPKGFLLYKQFIKPRKIADFEWYSLIPGYGESYGPYITTYKTTKKLKLINLGKTTSRVQLHNFIISTSNSEEDKKNITILIDPDEQYSGGQSNMKLHKLIKKYTDVDGTYINSSEVDDEYLEGATEIVLFKSSLVFNPF
jgi:hypothetical protein